MLTSLIVESKQKYYAKIAWKLADPNISTKTYWSILKSLLTVKKVPGIPIIFHQGKFFANHCSLIKNNSKIPTDFHLLTNKSLSSATFTDDDIVKTVNRLNPNKAHGHVAISIPMMIKLCENSIWRPLGHIFQTCLDQGVFPDDWKKQYPSSAQKIPINSQYRIIDQSLSFLFLGKSLKGCCLIQCILFY